MRKLLDSDQMLSEVMEWYKGWGFPTESASTSWEKMLYPTTAPQKWGKTIPGYDVMYTPSKSFGKAGKALKEVMWQNETMAKVLRDTIRHKRGLPGEVDQKMLDYYIELFKKQPPSMKKRMEEILKIKLGNKK